MKFITFSITLIAFCITAISYSQTPGIIVRPAGGGTVTKLNPNGDSWSSTSSSGYKTDDIAESEIPFKIILPTFYEPTGDLNRGPSGGFSDIVKDVDGSGFYSYFDGANLYFRLRIGGIVSGSKGYSVMIDADGKFGNSGSSPDPNYVANTSGSNGNPGFEWEIVLETNSRVAVYSVDGTNIPVLAASFPLSTNHQISVANSLASGDPDYFYDFYIPISATASSAYPITANTPLRMVATTVMSPQPAIGGPISDIFGINNYTDQNAAWSDIIKYQTPSTPATIQSSISVIGSVMSAAPVLTTPISSGNNVTVSGTWTRLDSTKADTASIKLYKNGTVISTITAASGTGWSIPALNISQNDILYVTAQGTNEAVSPQSNMYKVLGCTAANTTSNASLTFSCVSDRGMQGARPANVSVKVYRITAVNPPVLYADDANFTYKVTYGTITDWRYDSLYTQSGSACTGGQADISLGQYAITATSAGYCESAPVFTGGCSLSATTVSPVISQTTLYEGNTTVSGTAPAASTVKLYKNGLLDTAIILASGVTNYTFSNRTLYKDDVVEVRSQSVGQCESTGTKRTVVLQTSVPFINTSSSGTLIAGAATISGTSSEPAGTVVTVYESGVSKGTATVLLNGTWSFTYTVLSGKTYYATQQRTGAAMSAATATYNVQAATTAIPLITGSYTETTSPVVVNVPAGFAGKVFLYEDGQKIDSISVNSSASASNVNIPVNTTITNKLYAGGVLTATAQSTGSAENQTTSNAVTVTCAIPPIPTIFPDSSTIYKGDNAIFTVTSAESGILFTLRDSTDQSNLSISAFGNGSDLQITSFPFTSNGNFPVRLKATSFSGPGCESYATANVNVISSIPSVETTEPSYISMTSATVGGDVTTANGETVTERGLVYNTSDNPTTSDAKIIIGSGIGTFSQSITGLTADTKYYVRAYAINSVGTAYGNEINFTTAAPSAPSTPIVSDSSNSGFMLLWNPVNDATSYKLDVATDSTFTSFITGYNNLTVNDTSVNVTGLTSGTVYYFRLRAVNSIGTSPNSKTGSITTTTLSSNASLSSLAINAGTLSPAFDEGTLEYSDSIANETSSITVTPTVSDSTAIVTVNGTKVISGSESGAIVLNIGENTITVSVTAQDGVTEKIYSIKVIRQVATPSVPNMARSTDLGISNTDNITSDNTPLFVGTADPNTTVTLFDNNVEIGSGTSDSAGNWSITSSVLADGAHSIASKATINGVESAISNALAVVIDKAAPLVTSITRLNPNTATTSANTVTYRITFNEKISGLTAGHLTLTTSSSISATIASVTSDTGKIIDVTINNITGEGQLRLDLNNNTTITDVAGNTISGGYTTGEEYTILSHALPVTITDLKAYQKSKVIEVDWKATAEINLQKYEIEKGTRAINFVKAGEITVKENAVTNNYTWIDEHPIDGSNFYRLKTIDKDGSIKYSEIKRVDFKNLSSKDIQVSPNPITNKTLRFILKNMDAGKYQWALYNNKGQKIFAGTIFHEGGTSTKSIQLPSVTTTGTYTLHFSNLDLQLNKVIIIE